MGIFHAAAGKMYMLFEEQEILHDVRAGESLKILDLVWNLDLEFGFTSFVKQTVLEIFCL